MSPVPFHTVDAFTSKPFSGNPAAVIVWPTATDARSSDFATLLALAAEFNLSETAFALPLPAPADAPAHEAHFGLRWFTPAVEVKLCGHATLATAHVLFSEHAAPHLSTVRFSTLSGQLVATRTLTGISLDFPQDLTPLTLCTAGSERYDSVLRTALTAAPALAGRVLAIAWSSGMGPLVEVAEEVDLERLEVDSTKIVEGEGCLTITQKSTKAGIDIHSRFFAPGLGVNEDPVTGSAHCYLATYWLGTPARARLGAAFSDAGRMSLRARQVSARGGEIDVEWMKETGRVRLAGHAVTVMSGTAEF